MYESEVPTGLEARPPAPRARLPSLRAGCTGSLGPTARVRLHGDASQSVAAPAAGHRAGASAPTTPTEARMAQPGPEALYPSQCGHKSRPGKTMDPAGRRGQEGSLLEMGGARAKAASIQPFHILSASPLLKRSGAFKYPMKCLAGGWGRKNQGLFPDKKPKGKVGREIGKL